VIFQQFGKYDLTIAENIAFEKAHTIGLDIRTIAKQLELDHTFRQYPQGYETILGPYWGGKNLSGGEWQEIALARVLIRNVGLLIFDEPTSALDIETEYQLIQKIQSFKTNKAILLISHRFSTVRLADKIIVLDQHKIVETGTHEELMKYQGKYATMFKYQTKTT
jgi:ATP-binding cassette, subfamily B, bacterial